MNTKNILQCLLLAAVLMLLGPAQALTDGPDITIGDTPDPCTPDTGDYWVEYCVTYQTEDTSVRYVAYPTDDDPWCIIYPVPCTPGPDHALQFAFTDARLTYADVDANVNGDEVCDDLDCPSTCQIHKALCTVADPRLDATLDGAAATAFADVNEDGYFDAIAVKAGGHWNLIDACQGYTLGVSCVMTATMDAEVLDLRDYIPPCTPEEGEYWVDHCTDYQPRFFNANMVRATTEKDEYCVVYPVPCATVPEPGIEHTYFQGDVYVYRSDVRIDRAEMMEDLCDATCQVDMPGILDRLCPNRAEAVDQAICDLKPLPTLPIQIAAIEYPELAGRAGTNVGLADIDGDGRAEGMAFNPVLAYAGTEPTDPLMPEIRAYIPWYYVDFGCLELDPMLYQFTTDIGCRSEIHIEEIAL